MNVMSNLIYVGTRAYVTISTEVTPAAVSRDMNGGSTDVKVQALMFNQVAFTVIDLYQQAYNV